jgi:hypothetical protein
VDDLINDLNDLRKDQEIYSETLLEVKTKHLKLMQKVFPEDYTFFPRTWITPYEFFDLNNFIA